MSGRITGGKKTVIDEWADRLYVHKLDGMHDAVHKFRSQRSKKPKPEMDSLWENTAREMARGTAKLPAIVEAADLLVDEAIAIDPRLAKKSSWQRCEMDTAMDMDVAMFASGDEKCGLDRRKVRTSDRSMTEVTRIVISTDSRHVTDDHAKAFIAAAKLAQQFRPLEIWWQGAWLLDGTEGDTARAGNGFIFHVPLLSGDMDWSRIQFILSSDKRDWVSQRIQHSFAFNNVVPGKKIGTGAGVGQYSHLEDTHHFVQESGIRCDACSIARVAASWAGFESAWREEVSGSEALQSWSATPYKYVDTNPETPAQREARWKRQEAEALKLKMAEAKARLAHV